MKLSTQWALVVIGVVIASSLFFNFDHSTAIGVAHQFGFAVGVALIALIVGAATRFKRPIVFAVVYALCYFVVLFGAFRSDGGIHDAGTAIAKAPTQAASALPGFVDPYASSSQSGPWNDYRKPTAPQPTSTPADDWNTAALTFEQAHPDLKLGQNTVIMQRALDSLNTGQSNAQLLQDAYAAAQQDYSWTAGGSPPAGTEWNDERSTRASDNQTPSAPVKLDVVDPFAAPAAAPVPVVARAYPAADYLQETTAAAANCQSQGGEYASCWVKASPQRCTQQTLAMLANPSDNRRAWALCVRSCADAGVMSRGFGECKRESF